VFLTGCAWVFPGVPKEKIGRVIAMTLRHIDPRSIDWLDAMLEGEVEREAETDEATVELHAGAPPGQRAGGREPAPAGAP
jgi:hypothetical protein